MGPKLIFSLILNYIVTLEQMPNKVSKLVFTVINDISFNYFVDWGPRKQAMFLSSPLLIIGNGLKSY